MGVCGNTNRTTADYSFARTAYNALLLDPSTPKGISRLDLVEQRPKDVTMESHVEGIVNNFLKGVKPKTATEPSIQP
ncbi:hypothetical protein CC1G_06478 [Coprinopsis cinerea okayama7|uniref:Uncharacterized protein n=1 Tax=Coprinopsis cinerea (strain Okayama-7 / 130 / ATCC MYA-4618 / FGSC 9003) TaxID=240176 RepID=A8NN92_COPC7|nr:hypothetical protein CC1G_06478 [Coprinopsis cinerea okayama7\|eukprot:XP_001835075.2 hypothetical protein CC1G_06478 [Coprinopsis cinerea okayama7\